MAVNEAEILSKLNIGIARPDPVSDATVIAITSWHEDAIRIARDGILRGSLSQSGTIAQSITAMPIIKQGKLFKIQITGEQAVLFIDRGVNGLKTGFGSPYSFKYPNPSGSHIKAILKWIPASGFRPHGKIKTFTQLAYAIATATKQHGIKPKRFIEAAFGKQSQQDLARALGIALAQAVRIEFRAIAVKHKNK